MCMTSIPLLKAVSPWTSRYTVWCDCSPITPFRAYSRHSPAIDRSIRASELGFLGCATLHREFSNDFCKSSSKLPNGTLLSASVSLLKSCRLIASAWSVFEHLIGDRSIPCLVVQCQIDRTHPIAHLSSDRVLINEHTSFKWTSIGVELDLTNSPRFAFASAVCWVSRYPA